ncbi:dendritic arbor reduction protein 1 isoform X4 [Aedes aegypti]|uniref:Uncharacterized protein n=1 Tax=Aedes aegypti TaxID=7159 RepID=A0A6I8U7G1_AEDAE|nr:dendritic arbor reduction protein 1 isoform X4 [Aedes aegypti]
MMKLFIVLIAVLALYQRVEAQNATSKVTDADSSASEKEKATEEKTKETTNADARGKRNLELGNYGYNYYQTVPYRADRRISNAFQDSRPPYYHPNNYIHHSQSPSHQYHGFESDVSNSVNNYQPLPPSGPHHHHPVYLEAPEPIIEIIIKESNDSTLYEQQSIVPSQKKKKEEVQVFYVKYHKDDKHGIVLDTPIPALKPLPDESEEEVDESSLHEEPIVVTPSPPQKTTTLRAIINPDSEKYHSNSGIRISFGVEDKHQSGHQISETESESVAQPVVALPQGHVLPQPQAQTQPQHQAVHQQSQPQLHHQHHSSQHKADQFYQQHQQFLQQRSFPTPVPFASQPQYHQQAPQPHQSFVQNFGQSTAVPQYRAQPQYQYQQYQPQSHRFQQFDQSRNFAQPQQQFRAPVAQPQQYVQQPRQQQRPQPAHQTNFVWNGGATFASSPKPQQQFQQQQQHQQQHQQQFQHQQQQQRQQFQSQPTFGTRTANTFAKTTPLLPTTPRSTTTQRPTTTTTTPASAVISEKKQKAILDLPAEVPDDIRQHLLSSGILDNADISVLDYDKLGETSLDNLPPEHLANFFSSGGASQLAGSSNVVSVVKPNGEKVAEKFISKNYDVKDKRSKYEPSSYEEQPQDTMPEKQNVDLKVVRFDSSSQKNVTDRYIKHDSTILPSVDVTSGAANAEQNDEQSYNRYLPLKINGAQFPIPDVAELRGRRISSVVVLAPVDNIMPNKNFVINAEAEGSVVSGEEEPDQPRFERDTLLDSQKVKFIAGEALKQLIKKPSTENFKRWLEREGKTDIDLQSVVLLVTRNENDDQEIFMYDIGTKGVTHLNGELSQAFVKVAEENAQTQNLEELPVVDSGIVEQMGAGAKDRQSEEASSYEEDADLEAESDEQAEASEQKPIYVYPINSKYRRVQINSGYSNIKN